MRSRQLKPELFGDIRFQSLSLGTTLYFLAIMVYADDYGRCNTKPSRIIQEFLPGKRVCAKKAHEELLEHGWVENYEVGGQKCFKILNWDKLQTVKYPSVPQAPIPDSVRTLFGECEDTSKKTRSKCKKEKEEKKESDIKKKEKKEKESVVTGVNTRLKGDNRGFIRGEEGENFVLSNAVLHIYRAHPRPEGRRKALTEITRAIARLITSKRFETEELAARYLYRMTEKYTKLRASVVKENPEEAKYTRSAHRYFQYDCYDDPASTVQLKVVQDEAKYIEIYNEYPRHSDKEKAISAIKKTLKLLHHDHQDVFSYLLNRVKLYAKNWQFRLENGDDPKYIPSLKTWLEDGGYNDTSLIPPKKVKVFTIEGHEKRMKSGK